MYYLYKCMFVKLKLQNNSERTEEYLEELGVIVHKKEHQSFSLRPSQLMVLNKSPLESATD